MNTKRPGHLCEFATRSAIFVGVAFVAAATAMQSGPGGGGPVCNKRVDIPMDSQSGIASGCTSWTECDETWQCAAVNPGPQVSCGPATSSTRYCKTCSNGYWNSGMQRCELGVSGSCGAGVVSGSITKYLSPEHCTS